jgi:hypothetical protein
MKLNTLLLTASLGLANGASAALLYNNGPLITHPGQGFGGANASALASSPPPPMTTLGFGMQTVVGNRVADDFTVPAGQNWLVSVLKFYGYQTGSSTTSTFTGLNAEIWNGRPGDAGATVVWGNFTDNLLTSSAFTGSYRVTDTTLTVNNRPIMELQANVSLTLPSGDYWLEWSAAGSLGSGPWVPPITIVGQTVTGNARQYTNNVAWRDALDDGTSTQQGLPFMLEGDVESVPEPGQWAMMAVTLAGAGGFGLRQWRSRRAK